MPEVVYPKKFHEVIDETEPEAPGSPLKGGGGGDIYDGMEGRVSALETHMEYVRADLGEIKSALRELSTEIKTLPTKRDLNGYVIGGIGLALAAIAIVIGGLGWLETRATRISTPSASAVQPIVIQLPAPPPVASIPSKLATRDGRAPRP